MATYICVLDFEATCYKDKVKNSSLNHEIIEFPSYLWKWEDECSLSLVDTIQIFVKPSQNPVISEFCFELTGITQEQVDSGISLGKALGQHFEWLSLKGNIEDTIIVTCGNWDLLTMLPADLKTNNLGYPHTVYKHFMNIKQIFCDITKHDKAKGMTGMLTALDLKLEGRHHSGIDDCHNISQIFCKIVDLGFRKSDIERYIINV